MADKVVVIGGSGFLGSHVAEELSDRGFNVVVYDAEPSPWIRNDQKMVVGTLENSDTLKKELRDASFVYHFAGIADIKKAEDHPLEALRSNIMGSANVIEACLNNNRLKRLVFASSVYVYSDQGSFYRVSKQTVEMLLEAYQQRYGLNYTILRYGSLYGPRSQDWNGLKQRINQAVKEKRIDYPGTGEERREYIHVKDAARMSVDVLGEGYNNGCFTLTGTQILSSRALLELINEIMGGDITLDFDGSNSAVGHYGLTPYRYTPKTARKIVPVTFYDIGQGILELIDEVYQANNGA